jgi:hypothetical protein
MQTSSCFSLLLLVGGQGAPYYLFIFVVVVPIRGARSLKLFVGLSFLFIIATWKGQGNLSSPLFLLLILSKASQFQALHSHFFSPHVIDFFVGF